MSKNDVPNTVKIKLLNGKCVPQYMTDFSSGMDLKACIDNPITIRSLERLLIPTGIIIDIPQGYEGQVRPRSGLALKYGLTILNSPGTVDADYRGEIKIILVNISRDDYVVEPYERIAQLVICEVPRFRIEIVEELLPTKRGSGGFGHTGTK